MAEKPIQSLPDGNADSQSRGLVRQGNNTLAWVDWPDDALTPTHDADGTAHPDIRQAIADVDADATLAKNDATQAVADAAAAQSTANSAQTAASAAQVTADNAQASADAAETDSTAALNAASAAQADATQALADAAAAQAAADSAQADATQALASTGVRNVLGLFTNGWTATRARLHRVGNVCEIQVTNLDGSAASGTQFLDLSGFPGFEPIGGHLFGAWDNDNNVSVRAFLGPDPTFTCLLNVGRVDWHHVWTTESPFPTVLPGV